jgi:hypothetical protein
LNGIKVGKYAFRAASIIIGTFILVVVAGPILGAVTPQIQPTNELGLGVNLQTVQPQLQQIFSSPTAASGSHTVTVPAFNRWVLPASISLSLSLSVNGTTVYQTPKSTAALAPFSSGQLNLTVSIPADVLSAMQGQEINGGGQMTLQEGGLWSITVSLGQ